MYIIILLYTSHARVNDDKVHILIKNIVQSSRHFSDEQMLYVTQRLFFFLFFIGCQFAIVVASIHGCSSIIRRADPTKKKKEWPTESSITLHLSLPKA